MSNAHLNPTTPVVEGTVIQPSTADRVVAFFIALGDTKVSKDWSQIGKTVLAITPALVAIAAKKGGAFRRVRDLIAPGVALGKLVVDVNRQVTPTHLHQAHASVERSKRTLAALLRDLRTRLAGPR